MSIEEKIEQAAYAGVRAVFKILRPLERERILKAIIMDIMIIMKWESVTLKEDDEVDLPKTH